jgi:LPXTG-motif cell wall-anchored protein
MNFEKLWPPTNHPYGFWIIMGAMVAISAGLVYFFRRKRML